MSAVLYVGNSAGSTKKETYVHIYVYMYVKYIISLLENFKTLNTNIVI